ncbi:hypothetical protein [Halomonas organivorans]|uniref:Gamma-glutamylcyclotransferase (GGCT)/AIG2-like uncharacterized protein YtfP n=1 Tax=Halomonas organivorans TaxID=257772 RepID=A0A7W5G7D6_9GAMM|nr:hypothetical protein [Halomonas organivorans]MBB3142832.1 gamma-glutamylcyclotransferase (GGCT)/AIG2-like uncharacterized protein YtfP [Halomonas organivorans]
MNYEAIGRCQVLRKDVERLHLQRNSAITALRGELRGVMGSIKGTVYTFDPEAAHRQLAEIEDTSRQLMEAVAEFNEWAPEAGERPITVAEPRLP